MTDVLIIGAGFAGMVAAIQLAQHGMKVTMLEAKDRAGGRVFTLHDTAANAPIELGAEFIHGRPHEIWDLLRQHKIPAHEVEGDTWCFQDGKLNKCDFFTETNEILDEMSDGGPDQSFDDFLSQTQGSDKAKGWARNYVMGFHAADPSLISLHSLVRGTKADQEIDGERAFRIPTQGYEALRQLFLKQLGEAGVELHLATVAKTVIWRKGYVELHAESLGKPVLLTAKRCLVTLPLGVLQAWAGEPGTVQFEPELPPDKVRAIDLLAMGGVIRVDLCFREAFWRSIKAPRGSEGTKNLSFLLTQHDWFPTWWTPLPDKSPLLTGWAPFGSAEKLSGRSKSFVIEKALETLASILSISSHEIESLLAASYTHDWQSDPYARGAYSYVKVGGEGAQRALGAPINGTLFFAGEATDVTGHHGTVHGAMASGYRTAAEIINS